MIIAPSVLSLDYGDTKKQLDELKISQAEWLHFDVMDGHFVNNLSFGPHVLKTMKKSLDNKFYDVHLMVDNPRFFAKAFVENGADLITFHYEVMDGYDDCIALINEIKAMGAKVGMSVKPKTDVAVLKPLLKYLDLVLIMSVEPGFGGQSFIENSLDKISELSKVINENNLITLIEVDGGINDVTGKKCKEAGANVLVAGSYIFNNDIQKAINSLC